MIILVACLIIMLSYMYGCFSTARIVAKSFRSLNIYKVGTGLSDTENIYTNISKPLGILVGALDVVKAYVYLLAVEFVLRILSARIFPEIQPLYGHNIMLLYGLGMLAGHCLPLTNRFRGGRGIFTYMGFIAYFAFVPTLVTAIIALVLVVIFRQIRFAQYLIVILPVVLFQGLYFLIPSFHSDLPPYFITIMWGNALVMGILNYMVSKHLGEI
ncbi:MAG TPA: glycerol-3-phosphate acyltransferase [Candidatus Cloacimonadota bacterium]|nr:glycerol-3-phosphate acyltransferase [Candidatus Cloacimonadota bacterium]